MSPTPRASPQAPASPSPLSQSVESGSPAASTRVPAQATASAPPPSEGVERSGNVGSVGSVGSVKSPLDRPTAEDVFLLPAAGFFADPASGAGHVHLSDNFFELEPENQLAILNGWRKGVEESRRRTLVQMFRRGYDDHTRALPERLDQFRRDLAQRGIEVPADFALALQRY